MTVLLVPYVWRNIKHNFILRTTDFTYVLSTDHSKSRADIEECGLILFLAFWCVIFISKIILSFVCPFPVLVHHELLFGSFNRWWQEAIISLTLSNIEDFPSNRDQWFFWDSAFLAWTGLTDKTGYSDVVVVVLSYKVLLQCR